MSKAPAFQMYAADFLVDTDGWTATEVGIYTRLLMSEWVNGKLPTEIPRLARIAGIDLGNFIKCWSRVVGSKFSNNGTPGFINDRLELERKKQDKYRELQSQKGKLGGRPEKSRSFSTALTEQKPEESSSSSSSTSKNKRISINKLSDSDFLAWLKDQFPYVDFEEQDKKMVRWFALNPARKKTRKFVVKWYERIDRPLEQAPPKQTQGTVGMPEWIEKAAKEGWKI